MSFELKVFLLGFVLILIFGSGSAEADVAYPKQYGFQDPATIYVENMVNLHHDIMMFLIFICIFVFYMLLTTIFKFNSNIFVHPPVDIRHNTIIEIIWTVIPTFILVLIAMPSFALLYSLEEYHEPLLHIKAIGNQWYWTYECSDFYNKVVDPLPLELVKWPFRSIPVVKLDASEDFKRFMEASYFLWVDDYCLWNYYGFELLNYDHFCQICYKHSIFGPGVFLNFLNSSYWKEIVFKHSATMLSELDVLNLRGKALRLLSTDNILVLPSHVWIKISVTANDVLHSWTIPSFGVKLDGCPGRLNSSLIYLKREGVFYGQCSEICGVQHGFMPIEVHVIEAGRFLKYAIRNF